MAYLQLVAGFVLLLAGAEYMVRGAVALAARLGVSKLLIGLTVVAYGTTAPELLVSLEAALTGAPGIAVGNVIGSNIANILLILGCAALIAPIACRPGDLRHEGAFAFGAAVLFIGFCSQGTLQRWHGAVMLALLVGLTAYAYARERRGEAVAPDIAVDELGAVPQRVTLIVVSLLGGLVGVVLGSHLLVTAAVSVARQLGVSEAVIGLSLVAVGTSLPELATAGVAAWRGHPEVALGNVIGANTFNILAIMGLVTLVAPLPVPPRIFAFDLWFMLAVTAGFIAWMALRHRLPRPLAGGFLVVYAGYVAWLYSSDPGQAMVGALGG